MHPRSPYPHRALLVFLLVLCGCLPSSCRREESRALSPSDSLSRRVAADTPEDTLAVVWTRTSRDIDALAYPRTTLFGPDGRLYVSDAQAAQVFVLDNAGNVAETIAGDFQAPYLAGFLDDTLAVFSPAVDRFDLVAEGRVVRSVSINARTADRTLLRYASVWGEGFAFKGTSDETPPFVLYMDRHGRKTDSLALPGAFWRHAGLLRNEGDTLLSLNFYRPFVYRLVPERSGLVLDTVRLVGFDSPSLARTRLFMRGEVSEPPLLAAAAAPADSLLFVLNIRPGWVQVDAYTRAGNLVRRLIQPHPGPQRDFFPIHLDARARAGGYDIAVVFTRPEARVTLFHWNPM